MQNTPRFGHTLCTRKAVRWLAVLAVLGAANVSYAQRAPVRDDKFITSRHIQNWKELKNRNIVMQQRDYSCGAAALATVMRYYWNDTSENATEDKLIQYLGEVLTAEDLRDRIQNGLTMTDLEKVANKAGYDAAMVKGELSDLAKAETPVIVGLTIGEFDHFVVVRGVHGPWVYIADSIRGNLRERVPTFVQQWQEGAMLVIAPEGATDLPQTSRLAVRSMEMTPAYLNYQAVQKTYLPPRPPNIFPQFP